jgi:hypothetical protein
MATVNFSGYATGTILPVRCRDNERRQVFVNAYDGGQYPHALKGSNGSVVETLTNRGSVYSECSHPCDVVAILPPAPSPRPVARGFNRSDMMPSEEHGSEGYDKILWRDSSDNDLILCNVGEPPSSCFDQWFPLAQLDFQVQEISESLKAHKEAAKAYKAQGNKGGPEGFTRGYLSAKGVEFSSSDFSAAFK